LLSILIITPNIVMLGVVKSEINVVDLLKKELSSEYQQLNIAKNTVYDEEFKKLKRPIYSMYWLFGDNKYLAMFMLLFIASILMVAYSKNKELNRNELMRFYLILGVLGFGHPISTFLTHTVGPGNLVWRYHWALPMGIIFSFFSANVLNLNLTKIVHSNKWGKFKVLSAAPIVVMIAISFFFIVLSINHLQKIIGSKPLLYKVNQAAYTVASNIVKNEKPEDKVLAALHVAEILPMLVRTSELVTSRPLYWRLPYFSVEDLIKRKRLQYLINNMNEWTFDDAQFINTEIKQRNITILTYPLAGDKEEDFISMPHAHVLSKFTCVTNNVRWKVCQIKSQLD